jgi:hypothetical protein
MHDKAVAVRFMPFAVPGCRTAKLAFPVVIHGTHQALETKADQLSSQHILANTNTAAFDYLGFHRSENGLLQILHSAEKQCP